MIPLCPGLFPNQSVSSVISVISLCPRQCAWSFPWFRFVQENVLGRFHDFTLSKVVCLVSSVTSFYPRHHQSHLSKTVHAPISLSAWSLAGLQFVQDTSLAPVCPGQYMHPSVCLLGHLQDSSLSKTRTAPSSLSARLFPWLHFVQDSTPTSLVCLLCNFPWPQSVQESIHPQEYLKMPIGHCHLPVWASCSTLGCSSKFDESMRIRTGVRYPCYFTRQLHRECFCCVSFPPAMYDSLFLRLWYWLCTPFGEIWYTRMQSYDSDLYCVWLD